jgi:hypothetical protein
MRTAPGRLLSGSHKTNFAESALSFTLDLFEIIPALLLLCEESAFRVRLNADPYLAHGMSLCATRRFAHSAALRRQQSVRNADFIHKVGCLWHLRRKKCLPFSLDVK